MTKGADYMTTNWKPIPSCWNTYLASRSMYRVVLLSVHQIDRLFSTIFNNDTDALPTHPVSTRATHPSVQGSFHMFDAIFP